MKKGINRRDFVKLSAAGSALLFAGSNMLTWKANAATSSKLISPGCRTSRVKVARIYIANPEGLWPKPKLDFKKEIQFYESEFMKMKDEFSDVDFVVDQLITSPDQLSAIADKIKAVDGILVIHLTLSIMPILHKILEFGLPTVVFAVPYSGHDWVQFGALQKQELGAKLVCMLTSDYQQLAAAIRPFRAIHHLREAKILNLTTRFPADYAIAIKTKFGTTIQPIELNRMIDTYHAIDEHDATKEAEHWIHEAEKVIEPSTAEIIKSCRMALAFEKLLDEENATVMTVDCYGSMFEPLCQAYAYPCIGFTRLNDMGLGGICESDLRSAMTHILFQGLAGKPGFISDPTVDESNNSIILAHCLGTTRMAGPDKPAAPYKLRSIMERQAGAVPQVKMQIGQQVTQAILIGTDLIPYFTGEIIDVPEADRGCRTKIAVKVDGDAETLWKNWSNGLHRVTCYGNVSKELEHFCRFMQIKMVNEAV